VTITVDIGNGSTADFPDGTPEAEIIAAISAHSNTAAPPAAAPAPTTAPPASTSDNVMSLLGHLPPPFGPAITMLTQPAARAGAEEGATLNWSDEINARARQLYDKYFAQPMGLADSPTPLTYETALGQEIGRRAALRDANPTAYDFGKGIGTAATAAAPGMKIAENATLLRSLLPLALTGGGYGAVAGAGNSPALLSANPKDLALDTALGAAEGAGTAMAIPVAGAGVLGAGKWVANKAASMLGSDSVNAAKATNAIGSVLREAGLSDADVKDLVSQNPAMRLADVDALTPMTGQVAAWGGPAGEAVAQQLAQREADKQARILPAIQQAFGLPAGDVRPIEVVAEANHQAAKAAAQPYYARAEQTPVELNDTARTLLSTDEAAPLWAKAGDMATTRQILNRLAPDSPAPQLQPKPQFNPFNQMTPNASLDVYVPATQGPTPTTMQKLQSTIMMLGDKGAEAQRAGRNSEAANYFGIKQQLQAELARPGSPMYNPDFVKANQLYAGPHAYNDAMAQGAADWRAGRPGQMQVNMAALGSEADKQAYRYGVMAEIAHTLGTDTSGAPNAAIPRSDKFAKIYETPNRLAMLKTVLGPSNAAGAEQLADLFISENAMHNTYRTAQTAQRDTSRINALSGNAGLLARLGVYGAPVQGVSKLGLAYLASQAAAKAVRGMSTAEQQAVNEHAARILMSRQLPPQVLQSGLLNPALGAAATTGAAMAPGLLQQPSDETLLQATGSGSGLLNPR